MLSRTFPAASLLVSCRGTSASDSQTPVRAVLELRSARDDLTTTRSPGRPDRAVVDGVELSRPTLHTTLLPTEPGATSFARLDAGRLSRLRAAPVDDSASMMGRDGAAVFTAAVLAASELPEVRAIAARHRLFPSQKVTN